MYYQDTNNTVVEIYLLVLRIIWSCNYIHNEGIWFQNNRTIKNHKIKGCISIIIIGIKCLLVLLNDLCVCLGWKCLQHGRL